MRKIFIKAARPAIAAVKAKAPTGETKALKKSIGVLPYLGVKTGSVYVGVKREKVKTKNKSTTVYAKFLEFGTKHIPKGKFTFFEPGIRESLGRVQEVIFQQLKSAIAKYAGS